MYSIVKILLVLKLTLILMIFTAGMGIVTEVNHSAENSGSVAIRSMEYAPQKQKITEKDSSVYVRTKLNPAEPEIIVCPYKRSLSDLRLLIEL